MTQPTTPTPETLSTFDATMIAEGCWELTDYEEDEDTFTAAVQKLINTGLAWSLQGSFGRAAMAMIESGQCVPADQYVEAEVE